MRQKEQGIVITTVTAAGSVNTSGGEAPAISGHQQGASEPVPWCIEDGIAS